jgi:hypothetical protein
MRLTSRKTLFLPSWAWVALVVSTFLIVPSQTEAATTITARSVSFLDVSSAIALASDGDTVIVPAGTASWASTLTITKGITLQGQTTTDITTGSGPFGTANDRTIIQDDAPRLNGQVIVINVPLGKTVRLSGFTLKAGTTTSLGYSGSLVLKGTTHALRVDHCHLIGLYNNHFIQTYDWVYGVIDHNILDYSTHGGGMYIQHDAYGGGTVGDKAWADPPQFGSANFLFIEDNCINNPTTNEATGIIDSVGGARWVMRYNRMFNATGGGHGLETVTRGTRAVESYNNAFHWTISSAGGQLRSGTMLSHDNTWYGVVSGANNRYLQCYRSFFKYPPWGGASGNNAWDVNDPHGVYASGTHTGANSATVLTDSTKSWTTNQWVGYTVLNTTNNGIGAIQSNTSNTISYMLYYDSGGPEKFNTGDGYRIYKLFTALDQPGRGKGDLIIRSGGNNQLPLNSTTGTIAWPHQALEPCYSWNDKYAPTNAAVNLRATGGIPIILQNREYYNLGVGASDTAVRAKYVAALNGTDYTGPYTYPHPLVASAPAPPTNLRIQSGP